MAEPLEKALEDIRREAIESRNLVIKTDNQLKTLHAELKLISKHNEDFQRRWWVGSAAAYVGFAVLCAVGAYLIAGAKASGDKAERQRLEKQLTDANAVAEKAKADAAAQASQDRSAAEVYRMMTTLSGDDRLKGIDALAKLDQAKLTPFAKQVLLDRANALKHEVGAGALERGKAAFRKQDYPGAVAELSRFMAMGPNDEDALEASWFLGNALVQVHKNAEAVPYLTRYVQGDHRAKNRDFAMWLLVQALDTTGQRDKAIEVAREALGTYPASDFAPALRARLAPKGTAAPAPAPAAAPAPAVPAKVAPAPPPALKTTPAPGPGTAPKNTGAH